MPVDHTYMHRLCVCVGGGGSWMVGTHMNDFSGPKFSDYLKYHDIVIVTLT